MIVINSKLILIFLLFVSCWVSIGSAQTPVFSPDMQKANELFQAQKWAEAANAYETVAAAEPTNPRAWFQLGWSRHGLGEYQKAIDSFQKALDLNKGNRRASFAMYGIASTYAVMKDAEKALEWLNKALEAKLPQPNQMKTDPNFAALQSDPRFQEIVEKADKIAQVCMNTPEYRAFDFWVGDWNVVGVNGQQLGTNKVVTLEDGCIIEENWTSQGGQTGKSFNFYNPVTHKWHQSYMGNDAGNWMMDGELKDGVLRYEGVIYSPNGKTLVRMNFYNLGPDKVRQTAELSSDDGKTWTPSWDGMYVRKK